VELKSVLMVLLLYESVNFANEGWVHWFVLHDGVTLATWVLAIFALIPLLSLLYVIRSKKRDDQFRLLQWLNTQFNSAAMVSARRETGNKMEEEDFFRDRKQFPYTSAWPIVNFFERVAFLWAKGRLDIGYLDVAYREYIFRILADFEKHLSGNLQQGRFLQLESLRDFLQKMDGIRHTDDLAAAIAHVKTEF